MKEAGIVDKAIRTHLMRLYDLKPYSKD